MIPLKDENTIHTFPFFTILIILGTVAIFIYQQWLGALSDSFIHSLALTPCKVTALAMLQPGAQPFAALTPFTALFLHASPVHLAGNMLFLWIFGNSIEATSGHFKFLLFYLTSGLAAALLHIAFSPFSSIPMLGASGAVSGIMGAYLLLYPRARIVTLIFLVVFIRTIRIPAWIFLILWFILQLIGGYGEWDTPDRGGVAFGAHIGGFLAGMLLIPLFKKRDRLRLF